MTFFVISDIHGSSTALKRALDIYHNGDFNKILICGDILYHGARNPLPVGYEPKEVIKILNSIKKDIIVVKGNCESEVDSMVLEFPVSGEYSYILTPERDIFMTHGHKYSLDKQPPLKLGSLFLYGHTHIPMAEEIDGIYCLNPGSISLPKGGFKPSYGVLSYSKWEVKELESGSTIMSCNL